MRVHPVVRFVFIAFPAIWLCTSCAKNNLPGIAAPKKDSLPFVNTFPDFTKQVTGQTVQLVDEQTDNISQYLAYVPAGYNQAPAKLWPVIIFLHGLGEIGTDVNHVKANGLPRHLDTARTFPFLVISPQCNGGGWWNVNALNKLLSQILKKYNCDPKRIYLTGLSMGGIETWTWAIQDPTLFAAIAPVSATGDPSKVASLKDVPTWVFHGDKDPTVSYAGDLAMVNTLKAAGGNVKMTTIKGGYHNIWETVYRNPGLYTWMLQQKLP